MDPESLSNVDGSPSLGPVNQIIGFSLPAIIFAALCWTSGQNYLLFHCLAEIFSIVVAAAIFLLAWNSRRFVGNDGLLFLGIGYLFVGFIDLLHTLAYEGMGVFAGYGTDLATQLWISGRFVEAITLLGFPLYLQRRLRHMVVFSLYGLALGLLLLSIFSWRIFPICFVEGVGLTPFKVISEYVICGLFLGAMAFLWLRREKLEKTPSRCLLASVVCTILAELSFTLYLSATGLSNLVGHLLKVISFFLIYRALIVAGLQRPYDLLFRELKRGESRLVDANHMLSGILDHTHMLAAFLDPQFNFVWVNAAYAANGNAEPSSFPGKNHFDLYPNAESLAIFKGVVASGEPYLVYAKPFSYPDQPERGTTYWDWSLVPVKDAGGKLKGLVLTLLEVTRRIRAEEGLREEKQLIDSYINCLPGLFYVFDEERFVLWNREWNRITGYSDEELARFYGNDFFAGDDVGLISKAMHRVFQEGVADAEAELVTKSGRAIPYYFTGVRKDFGGKSHLVGLGIDISKKKLMEREALSMERQIQQTQKLESLGVLAGGIAHDFNNILMAILGNADLAMHQLSQLSPVRNNLEEVVNGAMRAAELAKQMLAYSGKGRFVIEPIETNELIREMLHLLEVSLSKKAVIKCDLAEKLPAFDGDVTQIRQIIMNLITNASESLGEGSGEIVLSTGVMFCDQAYLDGLNDYFRVGSASGLTPRDFIYIEVADTGCGMSPNVIDKIFDPFFTTKFTGRGLGMSAVLGIVKGHRGAVKIESEVGKGSTVKVIFPLNPFQSSPAGQVLSPEIVPEQTSQGTGTILVVDDEEAVCTVTRQMLLGFGYEVLTAANGRDALPVFREHGEEIVCVLLDLTMPYMDGVETCRELCRHQPDVTVILCSGYDEQDAVQRFTGINVAGFLQKPYTLNKLQEKLREVLGQG